MDVRNRGDKGLDINLVMADWCQMQMLIPVLWHFASSSGQLRIYPIRTA